MKIMISILIFIIGSCFASFFGVIIDRVPNNESIIRPGSYCHNCNHKLSIFENIPIISYLFLGGKCKKCKNKIGIFSLIYEIIGGLTPLLIYLFYGINVESVLLMIMSLLLLLMAGYDYKTNTITNTMWIMLLPFIFVITIYRVLSLKLPLLNYLYSFLIGGGIFLLIKLFGLFVLHKDILGTGDVIVFAFSCLLFKPFDISFILLFSCVPGSIIELIKLKKNNNSNKEIPFLPYLSFGIYCAILFSDKIINLLVG